jgi:hypothetical protein
VDISVIWLINDSIDRLRTLFTSEIGTRHSPVRKIGLETRWVDRLQKKIDYGNKRVLENFKLRLVFEDEGEE